MNTKDQLEAFDAKQKEERLAFIEKLKTELNKHLPVPRIEIFQCKVARSGFDYSKNPKFVWKCVLVGPQGVRRLISAEEDDSPWNETTAYKRALEWSETAGWPVVNREYCPEENEV